MRLVFKHTSIAITLLLSAMSFASADAAERSSTTVASTSPASVSGVGASELKQEIRAEKVRVAQLTKGAWHLVPGIARTLRRHSSGNDVRLLQDFLKLYGTFSTTTASSGFFGTETARAVREFQSKELIDPVGVVGPKTRARILALSTSELVQEEARAASSSAPAAPQITDVIFSSDVGEDGSGIGSSTLFASTTKNIYAILTLSNAAQDTEIGIIRYYNGAYVDSAVTHPSRSGLQYMHVQWSLKAGVNRTPGAYTISFYVNGNRSKTAAFTIN